MERDTAKAQRARDHGVRHEARERYEDLTKAELTTSSPGRDVPKTGIVDDLIDRLVAADTN